VVAAFLRWLLPLRGAGGHVDVVDTADLLHLDVRGGAHRGLRRVRGVGAAFHGFAELRCFGKVLSCLPVCACRRIAGSGIPQHYFYDIISKYSC